MRKLLIAALAAAIVSLLGAVAAFADGGPHGRYEATANGMNSEDRCAGCHRAHTGYASLLTMESQYELCVSCHGGTGASLNVLAGTDTTTDTTTGITTVEPTNAGGFTVAAGMSTSIHTVNGNITSIPDATSATMARGLTCGSCHDPHGMRFDAAGTRIFAYGRTPPAGSVEQYRMLRGGPDGQTIAKVVSNETPKSYTTVNWKSGTSEFCGTCHDLDMLHNSGTTYRHQVNVPLQYGGDPLTTILPLQKPGTSPDQLVCMTCHKSHGTTAINVVGTRSTRSNLVIPGVAIDDSANPTYLLRMNNRGVCQDCHKK